jgi:hypothetical protein
MLEFLRGKVSERKLRLLAAACCRRIWDLLSDRYCRKALSVAERYADSEVPKEKLGFAFGDARRSAQVAHRQDSGSANGTAMWAVSLLCEADIGKAIAAVYLAAQSEVYPTDLSRFAAVLREQSSLLRDIFSNPFRPLVFTPAWRTAAVLALAEAAYEERVLPAGTLDPDRLGVLADALEDAGCSDEAILSHLRGPGPHVRGCWVIDLLLSKDR